MPPQVQLTAKIAKLAGDSLRIGANPSPPNEIRVSIENRGEEIISEERRPPNLYLKGRLGEDAAALFLEKGDAKKCTITPPAGWNCDWDFTSDDSFCLKIYSYEERLFEKDGAITITLSNVISKTEVGVQNLPGDSVTLKWRTYELSGRTLDQIVGDPLPADFTSDEGTKKISGISADTTYRLKGYDKSNRPIERTLKVEVLRSGWYGRTNSLLAGDPGYPSPESKEEASKLPEYSLEPTLLVNANDSKLYGLFRFIAWGRELACLFETNNPFGPWELVNASVPEQRGSIPECVSTSPGVNVEDKLWLVGGSQVDPEKCSNGTWCFDQKRGSWESWGTAPWSARMGHAVVLYQKQIWVMGGRDEAGNALNDQWALDVNSKTWLPKGEALWAPRCMFNPTVFQEQLWLYGGAQEPFSSNLYDDIYTYKDGAWIKQDITGIIAGNTSRKPIASCLQVFKKKLCLFGKFRTIDPSTKSENIEPLAFSLSTPSTKSWDSFSNDGLKGWGGDTTFSYQLVNFKDMMLIAKALSYEATNPVMKIYVP